jgi:PhnB protein
MNSSSQAATPTNTSISPMLSVRMVMIVEDPDAALARAVGAGATMVIPVDNRYGWRLGRIADPFGHHWEIGSLWQKSLSFHRQN